MKKQLNSILLIQFLLIVGVATLLTVIKGRFIGLSTFTGGLIYWVPSALLMGLTSRYKGNQAVVFLALFFVGEAFKLLLCGVLFVLANYYLQINLLYGMIGLTTGILAWMISFYNLPFSGVKR